MGALVTYHNEMNNIPLRNLNEKEINLFFSIIYKAKDLGKNEILLDFIELKKLARTGREDKRLIKSLERMNKKLLNLDQKITLIDGKIIMFNLFNTFIIDPVDKTMLIKINENFIFMVNDLLGHFTKFELSQLVNLKSSYSKNVFRILKQFENTGFKIMFLEEFKNILCIPKNYKMGNIDQKVLKPVMEELSPIFHNLKIEKVKKGRKIDKLIFTWGKNKKEKKNKEKIIEIKENLFNAIERAKKNRFIKPFLSNKNIPILLDKYNQDQLIKGLEFARIEIKVEIKSINYLIKTIETSLETIDIKIVKKSIKEIKEYEEEKKEQIFENEEEEKFFEEVKQETLKILETKKSSMEKIEFLILKSKVINIITFKELTELIEEYKLND